MFCCNIIGYNKSEQADAYTNIWKDLINENNLIIHKTTRNGSNL